MKTISFDRLHDFLRTLSSEYDVYGPVALQDGTLSLGCLSSKPFALLKGKIPLRTVSIFFPHVARVLRVGPGGAIDAPDSPAKPILMVGLNADDLNALEFTDKVFLSGFRDDLYGQIRDRSIVIGVSGRSRGNGEPIPAAGKNCDLECIYEEGRFVLAPYTEKGNALTAKMDVEFRDGDIETLLHKYRAPLDPYEEILQQASRLLLEGKVDDDFWVGVANRCIECTTCNNVCPTCTCFDMYDVRSKDGVERFRQWDSCQLSGFMREASGHNPLGEGASRARRRIHHKLAADVQRWGRMSCFLCGRCDDSCPTGLGIKAVAKEIVERFG